MSLEQAKSQKFNELYSVLGPRSRVEFEPGYFFATNINELPYLPDYYEEKNSFLIPCYNSNSGSSVNKVYAYSNKADAEAMVKRLKVYCASLRLLEASVTQQINEATTEEEVNAITITAPVL